MVIASRRLPASMVREVPGTKEERRIGHDRTVRQQTVLTAAPSKRVKRVRRAKGGDLQWVQVPPGNFRSGR